MVKSVVVTIRAEGMEKDVELPCQIPLFEIEAKLLAGLKESDGKAFQTVSQIRLAQGKALLQQEMSLADLNIWDGSILTIRTVE